MKKILKLTSAAVMAMVLSQTLQAALVTGNISFNGSAALNNSSPANASAVNSWSGTSVAMVSGSFSSLSPGATTTFAPGWNFATSSRKTNFWAVGGYRFQLLASHVVSQGGVAGNNGFVNISGTGAVSGNGYDPTAFTWTFSAQDPPSGSGKWSFSATAGNSNTSAFPALAITWNNPAAINYGTALGYMQLNASATVAGSFAYTPAAGTILSAGTNTLKAVFTPADTGLYDLVTNTVSLVVIPPVFTNGPVVLTTADNGPGSLRADIAFVPPGTTIAFAPNLSGATLTLTNGELTLSNNITIDASALPGGIQISGNGTSRVFCVTNNSTVVLTALTIANGSSPPGDSGGGIDNESGTLTLNRCTLTENQASYLGGGILNYFSTLTLNQCTVAGNYSSYLGGGIYNYGGNLVVNQSTVAGNNSQNGSGVYNVGGTTTLTNSIVAGNSGSVADIVIEGGTLNLGGTNVVQFYSVIENGTLSGTPLIRTSPNLAPLANYGGPTPTMPPLSGSPAIDAGSDSATNVFATDQRGLPRLAGSHVDIGAVELQSPFALVVTTNADSGPGSLRQLVSQVDVSGYITFATNLSSASITLMSGQLVLSNYLTIDASALPGGIQINGNGASRIFFITNGSTVVLTALNIINGTALPGGAGGGIFNSSSTLTLNQCTLSGNYSTSGSVGAGGGGGIFNYNSTLTLNRCTLTGNYTAFLGGGIYNYSSMLTLNQCTMAGNYTTFSGTGGGGGIYNFGTLTVNQSTLTGNYSDNDDGAGGIYNYGGTTLFNSIVAGNSATGDASGADIVTDTLQITMNGTNIVQDYVQIYGGTFSGTLPITNAPLLTPLDNYGGPTPTVLPLPGSPAIDAGSDSATNPFATDQRGYPRLVGLHVDIGAAESAPVGPVVTNISDDGDGSLRRTVLFATNGATVTFAANLSGAPIIIFSGQITLNNNLTIDASALPNGIQIMDVGSSRIFNVTSNAFVTLNSLTVMNGNDHSGVGGGGIYNAGALILNQCTLSGNSANNINTFNTGGGGIFNNNLLIVNESTLTGNHSDNDLGAEVGGGGIYNWGNLIVNQSTLTGNSANNGYYGGGGIFHGNGSLIIYNSIVAGNTAISSAGADVYDSASSANLSGANLIQDFNGNYSGTIPISAFPQLATLGNYGGPTPTMPPLPGSPAIDACFNGTTFTNDQRGFPRIVGGLADIGSVEYEASSVVTTNLDGGAGSLRNAITYSTNGSIITFASNLSGQTITLVNAELLLDQNLTIDGSALSNGIAIRGGGASRVFEIVEGFTNVLTALTITNGTAVSGGGIYNSGNLTVNRCTLAGNLAGAGGGGGLYNAASATVNECTLTGNSVTKYQIALWTFETSVPATAGPFNPEFGGGSASGHHAGAAVYSSPSGNGSSHSFNSSIWATGDYYQFSVNTAASAGLVVTWDQVSSSTGPRDFNFFYSTDGLNFTQFGSTYMVSNNASPNLWSASTTITPTRYINNLSAITALNNVSTVYFRLVDASTTSASGGTVASAGTDRVDNFTVSATGDGGGIASVGTLAVNQSTLTGSTGGGIFSYGTMTLNSSIVAGNNPDGLNGTWTGGYNFTNGNPALAALGNYGGPTPTMPPLPGSPTIDAGNDSAINIFATDQRGLPRLSGPHVDIGAVEYQVTVIVATNPPVLTGLTTLGNGTFGLNFTSRTGASFTVFSSTNMALPLSQWLNVGTAVESPAGSGQFQFSDPQATNNLQRFYRVRSP